MRYMRLQFGPSKLGLRGFAVCRKVATVERD